MGCDHTDALEKRVDALERENKELKKKIAYVAEKAGIHDGYFYQ